MLPLTVAIVRFVAGLSFVVFGMLLLVGLRTRVAAVVPAGNMLGAIATAGTPALLVAMLFLLRAGPGSFALERR